MPNTPRHDLDKSLVEHWGAGISDTVGRIKGENHVHKDETDTFHFATSALTIHGLLHDNILAETRAEGASIQEILDRDIDRTFLHRKLHRDFLWMAKYFPASLRSLAHENIRSTLNRILTDIGIDNSVFEMVDAERARILCVASISPLNLHWGETDPDVDDAAMFKVLPEEAHRHQRRYLQIRDIWMERLREQLPDIDTINRFDAVVREASVDRTISEIQSHFRVLLNNTEQPLQYDPLPAIGDDGNRAAA
ncbi:MAG: hypothetical protein O2904_02445 [bacterium]|nr:hypothetical protein [bacterium]